MNMTQGEKSYFELWLSKSKSNFKIKHVGIKGFVQAKGSSLNIGFMSSLSGKFQQSPNAFSQFTSEPSSKVIYDFGKNSNFNLDFAPRPIPRFLPLPITHNEQNSENENQEEESLEEIAYKIFPNLGRTSRPDQIILNNYKLEASDFCKISNVPFDVLVQLPKETQCSCSVYFLYRIVRKIHKNDNSLKWLSNTPACYQNKYMNMIKNDTTTEFGIDQSLELIEDVKLTHPNEQYDLKHLEEMCHFNELIKSCEETNNAFQSPGFDFSKSESSSECASSFDYYLFDAPILDSDEIDDSMEANENSVVIVNQYEDDYEANEKFVIGEVDPPNVEIESDEINGQSNDKKSDSIIPSFIFEKISRIVLFILGLIGSIIFSVFILVSLVNLFHGRNKENFVEYKTETYNGSNFYSRVGDSTICTDHIYSTITANDSYRESHKNSQLVTSVKSKLDQNRIRYSKLDNHFTDSDINIKNNPFV